MYPQFLINFASHGREDLHIQPWRTPIAANRKINPALTLKYGHKAKVTRHREHQHKGDQDKQNRLTLEETGHSGTRNML